MYSALFSFSVTHGLKTLGVLDGIQRHLDSFRPLMCHEPSPLTADMIDHLFHIWLSVVGSNKRRAEEVGPSKLGKILAFATGASVILPVGFSPKPQIDFLHDQSFSPKCHLPMANTCINCLKLPLLDTYEDFKESMDFMSTQCTEKFTLWFSSNREMTA
uniref:HECT domain-containing protein n=1 Tax=Monopterus albus TaxID=43700 RepID=A0A3Q3J439_MONAL